MQHIPTIQLISQNHPSKEFNGHLTARFPNPMVNLRNLNVGMYMSIEFKGSVFLSP
jgi:hypothetical protein